MAWLSSYSGKKVSLTRPRGQSFDVDDIASGLSFTARFSGQTTEFYSVAQHCVHCSDMCPDYPLEALMHDASEAYTGDCPRPLKNLIGAPWREIEDRLMAAILKRFGISAIPPEVKVVDNRMALTEKRDLQPMSPPWVWEIEPFDFKITPWEPERAKNEFLSRFLSIMGMATERTCSVCGERKSWREYYQHYSSRNIRSSRGTCVECLRARGSSARASSPSVRKYKADPLAVRERELWKNYGLTTSRYEQMLAKQGGVCLICEKTDGSRRLVVDHCHETGIVRGLLCSNCNRVLGLVGESSQTCLSMASYIDRHAE